MFDRIRQVFFPGNISKETAKNRLQVVLVQDRSGLSSDEMEKFRLEIIDVISKYFTVDKSNLDIEWQREDGSTALIINTPVIGKRILKTAVGG